MQLQELIPASLSSRCRVRAGTGFTLAVLVRSDNPGTSKGHVCLLPLSLSHALPTHCNLAITEVGGWKRLS